MFVEAEYAVKWNIHPQSECFSHTRLRPSHRLYFLKIILIRNNSRSLCFTFYPQPALQLSKWRSCIMRLIRQPVTAILQDPVPAFSKFLHSVIAKYCKKTDKAWVWKKKCFGENDLTRFYQPIMYSYFSLSYAISNRLFMLLVAALEQFWVIQGGP